MTNPMHPSDPKQPDAPCPKCNQHHPRCAGHVKRGPRKGQPCMRQPKKGATVCYFCGGAAPQVRAAAARRRAGEEAAKVMATFGDTPTDTDPVEGLHLAICWARTHQDWLRAQVQKLLPDTVVFNDRKVTTSDLTGLTVEQRAEINGWVRLYNEERDRFVKYCTAAIRAGLAEREVRLAEKEGAMLAEVIRAVLADLELTPDQQARALLVVPEKLRLARQLDPNMN